MALIFFKFLLPGVWSYYTPPFLKDWGESWKGRGMMEGVGNNGRGGAATIYSSAENVTYLEHCKYFADFELKRGNRPDVSHMKECLLLNDCRYWSGGVRIPPSHLTFLFINIRGVIRGQSVSDTWKRTINIAQWHFIIRSVYDHYFIFSSYRTLEVMWPSSSVCRSGSRGLRIIILFFKKSFLSNRLFHRNWSVYVFLIKGLIRWSSGRICRYKMDTFSLTIYTIQAGKI